MKVDNTDVIDDKCVKKEITITYLGIKKNCVLGELTFVESPATKITNDLAVEAVPKKRRKNM